MNILLWILQILLALHTIMGAIWKFSNSEQAVTSIKAIPHGVWLAIGIIELICSICLIFPALKKNLGILVPIAATFIVAEMLLYCGLFIFSGDTNYSQLIYWIIVALTCAFIAYGRFVLKPL